MEINYTLENTQQLREILSGEMRGGEGLNGSYLCTAVPAQIGPLCGGYFYLKVTFKVENNAFHVSSDPTGHGSMAGKQGPEESTGGEKRKIRNQQLRSPQI